MAILNATVVPAKVLKDGRHKVRISVAHNGETRYIPTDIIIDSCKELRSGLIVKRPDAAILNTKLRGILQRYQSVIDKLVYVEGLTCPELVYQIKNAHNRNHRTIYSIYKEYVENANVKQSTIDVYKIYWSSITKFINQNMLVEHVTHGTVIGLDKHLHSRNLAPTTIHMHMGFFNMLINYAKRCGYANFTIDPLAGYKRPRVEIRQSWLSVTEIKAIRDLPAKKKNIAKCRDLFLLSYYLGGINMADLVKINFDENKDTIKYIRTKTDRLPKTNKWVEFEIPDEAKNIIQRYKGADGRLKLSSRDRRRACSYFFMYNMPLLAKATEIKHLIYYSARKSFSQHAFNLGVPTNVIDYILGHSVDKGGTSLYHYISVTPEMATKAIRLVLDNLK